MTMRKISLFAILLFGATWTAFNLGDSNGRQDFRRSQEMRELEEMVKEAHFLYLCYDGYNTGCIEVKLFSLEIMKKVLEDGLFQVGDEPNRRVNTGDLNLIYARLSFLLRDVDEIKSKHYFELCKDFYNFDTYGKLSNFVLRMDGIIAM